LLEISSETQNEAIQKINQNFTKDDSNDSTQGVLTSQKAI